MSLIPISYLNALPSASFLQDCLDRSTPSQGCFLTIAKNTTLPTRFTVISEWENIAEVWPLVTMWSIQWTFWKVISNRNVQYTMCLTVVYYAFWNIKYILLNLEIRDNHINDLRTQKIFIK